MSRTLQVRKPTIPEMRWLEVLLEGENPVQVQRRAQAILFHGLGFACPAIAMALHVHPNTIYADLHAFAQEGLACVRVLPRGGAPARLTPQQLNAIWQWAACAPRDFGRLEPRWTLENFRTFLTKQQRLLKRISLEHLRRVLKKRIFAFGASSASSLAKIHSDLPF